MNKNDFQSRLNEAFNDPEFLATLADEDGLTPNAREEARLREMLDAALEQSPEYHARNQNRFDALFSSGNPALSQTVSDDKPATTGNGFDVLFSSGLEQSPEYHARNQELSDIMGTIIIGVALLIAFGALITALFVTFRQIKKEWASRRIRQGVFVAIVWVASSPFALFYWESGFDVAAAFAFVPPFVAGLLLCLYRKIVG